MANQTQTVVVMVPFPAQGHLNQLLHLCRLLLPYHLPLHFVGTALHNRQASHRVHGWDPRATFHFHDFEIPSFPSPPPDPNINFPSHLIPAFNAAFNLQKPVSAFLRSLASKAEKVVVIHDSLMASVVQEVGSIPNAESYVFQSVSAFATFLFRWDRRGRPRNEVADGVVIPKRVPSLDGCFTKEFYELVLSQYEFHKLSSGFIYNTSRVIEGPYLKLIEKYQNEIMEKVHVKHFALGPFNPVHFCGSQNPKHFCLDWLDKQQPNSVIYISFGTTTAMSNEQIKQLALGLKQSNQKFIWVLREADKGNVFSEKHDIREALPKGYETSVNGMGLIVREWVPQLEILGHPATGGFMSHCGWNSCMESISMGVPIAGWPMHSDQPRNCVMIIECLKIGVVVREWEKRDEIVAAEMIETSVKRLMESSAGVEMRKRAAQIGESLRRSMGEGGVSRLEMDSFVSHICS